MEALKDARDEPRVDAIGKQIHKGSTFVDEMLGKGIACDMIPLAHGEETNIWISLS